VKLQDVCNRDCEVCRDTDSTTAAVCAELTDFERTLNEHVDKDQDEIDVLHVFQGHSFGCGTEVNQIIVELRVMRRDGAWRIFVLEEATGSRGRVATVHALSDASAVALMGLTDRLLDLYQTLESEFPRERGPGN
jgi:hypothetical protein